MPAAIVVEGQFDRNYDQLRLGFLKGSNPSAFKRLASFATLNAARTLQKPMRDKAPTILLPWSVSRVGAMACSTAGW